MQGRGKLIGRIFAGTWICVLLICLEPWIMFTWEPGEEDRCLNMLRGGCLAAHQCAWCLVDEACYGASSNSAASCAAERPTNGLLLPSPETEKNHEWWRVFWTRLFLWTLAAGAIPIAWIVWHDPQLRELIGRVLAGAWFVILVLSLEVWALETWEPGVEYGCLNMLRARCLAAHRCVWCSTDAACYGVSSAEAAVCAAGNPTEGLLLPPPEAKRNHERWSVFWGSMCLWTLAAGVIPIAWIIWHEPELRTLAAPLFGFRPSPPPGGLRAP